MKFVENSDNNAINNEDRDLYGGKEIIRTISQSSKGQSSTSNFSIENVSLHANFCTDRKTLLQRNVKTKFKKKLTATPMKQQLKIKGN